MEPSNSPEDALSARVGQRLRAARIAAGLTPLDIINAAGLPKSTYYWYENGAGNFTLSNLNKIVAVIGCSLSDLLLTVEEEEERRKAHERLQQVTVQAAQLAANLDRFRLQPPVLHSQSSPGASWADRSTASRDATTKERKPD